MSKPVSAGTHDVYQFNTLLTSTQIQLRQQVYTLGKQYIEPVINQHYESATFPFDVIQQLQKLNCCGLDIPLQYTKQTVTDEYKTAVSNGLIALELARFSTGISTFYSILQPITMLSIYKCGTEQQRNKYLPIMSSLQQIGAFGLTEPNAGSDASNLQCQCTPTVHSNGTKGWLLNGEKRWIGNGSIADIIVIWARNTVSGEIHGFIVVRSECEPNTLRTDKMENKIGLREIQNGHIYMNNVFVSESNRLQQTTSFASGPIRTLILTRIMASWIATGTVIGAYENCLQYLQQRQQFGTSLTAYQLIQERLMTTLASIQSMLLMCWRISTMYDNNTHSLGQIGLCKQYITKHARQCLSQLRDCQGGNGMITDYGVARAFADIEGVHTFEGSADINMMIAGREFLGTSAFYVPIAKKQQNNKPDKKIAKL